MIRRLKTIKVFIIVLSTFSLPAQQPSAIVDFEATDQGVLVPRTDTATVNASYTPATGLMIYQTTDNTFYYFNGTKWTAVGGADNLGNHMATENIKLQGAFISNDGDDEGLRVSDTGGVSVGTQSTTKAFEVFADSSFTTFVESPCIAASGEEITITEGLEAAQSFVADTTGDITKFLIYGRSIGFSTFSLSLKSGSDPSVGSNITSRNFSFGNTSNDTIVIDLFIEPQVDKGDTLTVVIEKLSGDNGIWVRSGSEIYANGMAWRKDGSWTKFPD